jgi:hypothetical protein
VNGIKKATDAADEESRLFFRDGDIWWVRLGVNVGYETDGRSREFTPPAEVTLYTNTHLTIYEQKYSDKECVL